MYLALLHKVMPCFNAVVHAIDGSSDMLMSKNVEVGSSSLQMSLPGREFKEIYDRLQFDFVEENNQLENRRLDIMHMIHPIPILKN
jgi:hypothetical protein